MLLSGVFATAPVVLACVVLAAGGSVATAAAFSTARHQAGSTSSGAFGQKVKAQVAKCEAMAPSNGKQGIGDCVSDFVTAKNPGASHESPTSPGSSDSGSTGSASSGAFGQKVKAQVAKRKAMTPSNGKQGIGDCVSDFVTAKNPGVSHHPRP